MPVAAIFVLQQRCPQLNTALEHVYRIECAIHDGHHYQVDLYGGPAPPPGARREVSEGD
jgi:hypothetical protein